MRFSVEVGALRTAVGDAVPVTEKKSTMPMLGSLLLVSDGKGALDVVATDLEVSLSRRLAVTGAKAGQATVAARAFYEVVKSLPAGQVTVEAVKGDRLLVSAGGAEFRLATTDPADYPTVKFGEGELDSSVSGAALASLLGRVAYASSKDETRYNLNGVFLERSETGLRAVATDGHRLALADMEGKIGKWPEKGLILGAKGVGLVRALVADVQGDVQLGVEGSALTVKAGDATLSARLVEAVFPEYRQVVPKPGSRVVTAGRDRLIGSLRRVGLVCGGEKGAVTFEVVDGEVVLRAVGSDVGEAKEAVPVSVVGGEVKIGFNPRYLVDALGSFATDDVQVQLEDALSPATLVPVGATDGKCVVMPMRV